MKMNKQKLENLVKEPLKNAVFVVPSEEGIQDLRQKINYKKSNLLVFQSFLNSFSLENLNKFLWDANFIVGVQNLEPLCHSQSSLCHPVEAGIQ